MSESSLQEIIDLSRDYVRNKALDGNATVVGFALAIVRLADACVIGLPCEKHGGMTHGGEAEDLRAGVERALALTDDAPGDMFHDYSRETLRELRDKLRRLLDEVDACDSLAFLERSKLNDEQLQAIARGESGSQSSTETICRMAEELLQARRILRKKRSCPLPTAIKPEGTPA